MTPHGPDTTTYESAILPRQEQPAHLGRDTLAFMFETSLTPRVTSAALGSTCIDRDYYKCWLGLKSHFNKNWFALDDVEQQQQQQHSAKEGQLQGMLKGVDGAASNDGHVAEHQLELVKHR